MKLHIYIPSNWVAFAFLQYVQETYPQLKSQFPQPEYQSKDIIAMVARQWQNVPDNEKKSWKQRAKLASANAEIAQGMEYEEDDEGEDDVVLEGEGTEIGASASCGADHDDDHDDDHENGNVEDVVNQLVGADADGNSIVVGNSGGASNEGMVDQAPQSTMDDLSNTITNEMHV